MWRGRNWKSSFPDLVEDFKEATKADADNKNYKTLQSEALDVSTPSLHHNPVEHVSNLSHDKNSKQSVSVVADASLTKVYEAETTNVATDSYGEPETCSNTSPGTAISHDGRHTECPSNAISDSHGTSDIMDDKSFGDCLSTSISGSNAMLGSRNSNIFSTVDPHADELLNDSGVADVSLLPRSATPCANGISLLLEQAVEQGSALVLDKDSLDADNIYRTTVSFAQSAPPGPVFMKHRKVVVQKRDKQEAPSLETRETPTVTTKGTTVTTKDKRGRSPRIRRKENFDERFMNLVPQGTLGVDELAKLLT